MKRTHVMAVVVAMGLLLSGVASAAVITGTWDNTFQTYTRYDITTATQASYANETSGVAADWAAFAVGGFDNIGLNQVTRKAGGLGQISSLSGAVWCIQSGGRLKLAFADGVAANGAPTQWGQTDSSSCDVNPVKGFTESFSTTIFNPTEKLWLYVYNENGKASMTADLRASNGAPVANWSQTQYAIGASTQGYGRLALDVSGATVGDVLTFTIQSVLPTNQYNGIALPAVAIVAVPEPITMAMLSVGAVALLRRRK